MNRLLDKYRAGEPSIGTFTHLLSTTAIECLAQTGLDYVIIDLEHSPISTMEAAQMISAASGCGLCPLVRVDAISRSPVLKMLDVGAQGLIVPQVESPEQVRELVGYAKFAPQGNRGFCPTRDGGWGYGELARGGMGEYMPRANAETLLLPQCETVGCLEHIEEIAAIDGVDGIFVGPFDLSISMGMPGDFENPIFKKAVERIRIAAADAGKLCIVFTTDEIRSANYFRQGFPSVTMGLDAGVLIESFRKITERAKNF